MTATIAFIAGSVFGALVVLFVIGIQAHHHFWAMNARKQDDHGQPIYDKDGVLIGRVE